MGYRPHITDSCKIKGYSMIIVAEITTNHFGSEDLLFKMIEMAQQDGATAVKLQIRNPYTLYSEHKLDTPAVNVLDIAHLKSFVTVHGIESQINTLTFRDYRTLLELHCWDEIKTYCDVMGILWGVSVLDIESYDFIATFGPDFIKIPSTVSQNTDLYNHVATDWAGTLVLSNGMMGCREEQMLIDAAVKHNKLSDTGTYILQTTSSYPTAVNDFNLKVMARYTGLDGIHGGFSDHSSAGHIIPVVAACALGADMVERHIKLPTTHVEKDTVADTLGFSNTFSQYCEAIKYTELALGTSVKTVLKSENHKYST